ncbi:SH3 domain-containing protein [Clostridium massiliamazoniense]|uniref:SH3 domain-containing protein n=1 Tax=Clostridium massiliamazoniense TaxID=1347366 RepID=UPI0006D82559|nr:SH3 domain-containing protein [Clostridium massiliamazoniense]
MNRKQLTGLIAIASALTAVGATGATHIGKDSANEVLLARPMKVTKQSSATSTDSQKYKVGITTAFIGVPEQENGFAADLSFNPNGFASPLNKKLYEYESSPANQTAAMDEAISLHNGNPENTCVYFQSSCLRAIGVPVPDSMSYTTNLESFLNNNGWQRETDFNYIQKGDICFAGPYHTFLFMGWKDKAKGIAYVMGDEAYMFNSSYGNRNLNGQVANSSNGWNNQYKATCFWKYTGNYTGGTVQNAPTNKWIGRIAITSPVGLWMNAGPSANTAKLDCIGDNIVLNVIEVKDGWYKVYYDGQYGWIDSQYTTGLGNPTESKSENVENANIPPSVSKAIGTTVINSLEGLEMNYVPLFNSNSITSIPNATKVFVFEETNNGWEKVYYNGRYGWIYSEYTTGLSRINQGSNSTTNNNSTNSGNSSKSNILGQVTIESPVGLWMTKGPRPYSGNITCLNYNTKVNVIGESNGWYEINYNGQKGWIDGAYTSALKTQSNNVTPTKSVKEKSTAKKAIKKASQNTGQEITIKSPVGLWMTKGPKPYSGNIVCLPYNTKVMATAEENGWYKISYDGQEGWVDGAYTTSANFSTNNSNNSNNSNNNSSNNSNSNGTNTTKKVSAKSNILGQVTIESPVGLWMTEGPRPYSGNITCLNYNTTVNVIGESNGWYEINYNGQKGWIDGAYTSALKTQSNNNVTPTKSVKEKSTTKKADKKASQNAGQEITIESPVGLWMTKGPKQYSGNIVCLPYNTKVMATTEENGWYKISYNGQVGWVDGAYTTSANFNTNNSSNNSNNSNSNGTNTTKKVSSKSNILGQVTIESPVGLWMTEGPRPYSGNITCLNYNTTVNVIGESNGWYEINYNGQKGWIDGAYTSALKTQSNNVTPTKSVKEKSTAKKAVKTARQNVGQEITIESPVGLWMTKGPKPYSGNIVCLPYNTKVMATAEENGWYKVNYNGQVGWVDGAYTTSANFNGNNNSSSDKISNTTQGNTESNTEKSSEDGNSKSMGSVVVESPIGLWMTEGPSGNSGNITCLNYETRVNVIGEYNGWYKITYNGKIGWIDSKYTTTLNNGNNSSVSQNKNKEITVASPIGLYMTYGPNGTEGVITCLPYGTELQVIGEENGWYEVNYNGNIGWVDGEYCAS